MKFADELEAIKRAKLHQLLNECTAPQQAFFKRIYPNGVPGNKVMSAIDLCERTINKNLVGRTSEAKP